MALNSAAITDITTAVYDVVKSQLKTQFPADPDDTQTPINLDKLATSIAALVEPLIQGIINNAVVSESGTIG